MLTTVIVTIPSEKPLPFDVSRAHRLYKELFGKVEPLIEGKKLLLVPSGPLTVFPFQALVAEKSTNRLWGEHLAPSQIKWLINRHDLTILPSISSLKSLRRTAKKTKAVHPFFGIGNPLVPGTTKKHRDALEKQACTYEVKPVRFAGFQVPEFISKIFRGGEVDLKALKQMDPLPETADELCSVAQLLKANADMVRLGKQRD